MSSFSSLFILHISTGRPPVRVAVLENDETYRYLEFCEGRYRICKSRIFIDDRITILAETHLEDGKIPLQAITKAITKACDRGASRFLCPSSTLLQLKNYLHPDRYDALYKQMSTKVCQKGKKRPTYDEYDESQVFF
jgi:hypothetical protein